MHQHTDGRLVLWTDRRELVFLTVAERGAEIRYLEEQITARYPPELGDQVRRAVEGCMQCHTLVPELHLNAPSLASVYRGRIAAASYSGYSDALTSSRGEWTRDALAAYIADPQEFAPGTTMPATGVDDPEVLEALVDMLVALKDPGDL